ncbi:MAG TPA: hypothetical protein VGB76_03385 [Pyrinomonadaceae bacterium]|jgi:hypothetical protein
MDETNTKRNGTGRQLTRKVARAGGLRLVRRLIKPIPIIGTAVALGFAGHEIRKKGWRNGLIHVGLDITPVVGTVKDVIEIFTGDLIPDKENVKR